MKYLRNIIGIITLIMLVHPVLQAQYITASVDTNYHLIGDHIHLLLRADIDKKSDIIALDLSAIDTSGFEILNEGEWREKQQGRMKYYTKDITLTHFDSGYYRVPPVTVKIKDPNGNEITERTPWIPVMLDVVKASEPAPIKGIYKEGTRWTDYLIYLYILLFVLLAASLIWWRMKRKKKQSESNDRQEVEVPPLEEALRALDLLQRKALWKEGKIKEYYSEISTILRRYLERRYGFPALEWTKREILRHISQKHIAEFPKGSLGEILRVTDLVKFAKFKPDVTQNESILKESRTLVSRMDKIALDPIDEAKTEEEE